MSRKRVSIVNTLHFSLAVTIAFFIFSCSMNVKQQPATSEAEPVVLQEETETNIIPNQESQSTEEDEEIGPRIHTPIGNTVGFITRIDENRDTLNHVRFLNEDGSCWWSFPADIYEYNCLPEERKENFSPWAFEPGIGVFTIRCIGISPKGYKVVVNETKNMIKYLEKNKYLKLETIEEHLLNILVGWDSEENPLRESPDDNAPTVQLPISPDTSCDLIYADKHKGDWIHVISKCDEDSSESLGWIRWRKDGIFMIEMYYSV